MKKLHLFFTLSIAITSSQTCLSIRPPRQAAPNQAEPRRKRFKIVRRKNCQWCNGIDNDGNKDETCHTVCICMWSCPILSCPLAWQGSIEAYKATIMHMKAHQYRLDYSILPDYACLLAFIGTLACSTTLGLGLALCTNHTANRIVDTCDPIFEEDDEE